MSEILIDSDTLKSLIYGAVFEAMKPYHEELDRQGDKILILETINQRDKGLCPQNCPCQNKLDEHSVIITENTASSKSAHHRIDGVFKTAAIVGGAVSGTITIILMVIEMVLQYSHVITKTTIGG